jgi:hypothetical protein
MVASAANGEDATERVPLPTTENQYLASSR